MYSRPTFRVQGPLGPFAGHPRQCANARLALPSCRIPSGTRRTWLATKCCATASFTRLFCTRASSAVAAALEAFEPATRGAGALVFAVGSRFKDLSPFGVKRKSAIGWFLARAALRVASCSPPSRTLRAACGGGLRPSLTAAARAARASAGRDEETAPPPNQETPMVLYPMSWRARPGLPGGSLLRVVVGIERHLTLQQRAQQLQ